MTEVAGYSAAGGGRPEPASLADVLERVLDKGVVIAGDIRIQLLNIELLTIRIRLIIASVERAQEMGINWWESDPQLSSSNGNLELEDEVRQLRDRVRELEAGQPNAPGDNSTAPAKSTPRRGAG